MGKGRSNIEGLDPESPRTLEACLHRGITIEELQPREEKTFRRGMESADFTHRRYDFFEKRRQDKIALVRSRRADLVRKSATHEGPGGLSTGEKRALEEAAKQKAATIEIERKRVESIKRKQQQEIARSSASRAVPSFDATRIMLWVVSFPSLSLFVSRRGRVPRAIENALDGRSTGRGPQPLLRPAGVVHGGRLRVVVLDGQVRDEAQGRGEDFEREVVERRAVLGPWHVRARRFDEVPSTRLRE